MVPYHTAMIKLRV